MKRRSLAVLVALVVVMSFVSSAIAGSSIYDEVKKRGVVRIGHGVDVPPLCLLDPKTGELKGFDIDMAKAMTKQL